MHQQIFNLQNDRSSVNMFVSRFHYLSSNLLFRELIDFGRVDVRHVIIRGEVQ